MELKTTWRDGSCSGLKGKGWIFEKMVAKTPSIHFVVSKCTFVAYLHVLNWCSCLAISLQPKPPENRPAKGSQDPGGKSKGSNKIHDGCIAMLLLDAKVSGAGWMCVRSEWVAGLKMLDLLNLQVCWKLLWTRNTVPQNFHGTENRLNSMWLASCIGLVWIDNFCTVASLFFSAVLCRNISGHLWHQSQAISAATLWTRSSQLALALWSNPGSFRLWWIWWERLSGNFIPAVSYFISNDTTAIPYHHLKASRLLPALHHVEAERPMVWIPQYYSKPAF